MVVDYGWMSNWYFSVSRFPLPLSVSDLRRPRTKCQNHLSMRKLRRAVTLGSPSLCKNVVMHPKSDGLLESSLYVQDVAASARFYERIFGFRMVSDFGERGCAMQAGERQVLLLFKKGGSLSIPSPHDGDGELHIAFAIPASELARWEVWLEENGIAVEEKRTWDLGGQSIYFRDPDRHLLEIASPGVWSIY